MSNEIALREAYSHFIAQVLGAGQATSCSTHLSPEVVSKEGSTTNSFPNPITFQHCPARVVLGRGLTPITPPDRSQCPGVLYWKEADWDGEEKPSKKSSAERTRGGNGAVKWTEFSNQEADDARAILYSLFYSLAMFGQIAPTAPELGYEATTYIHVQLGQRYPRLLWCDGGYWKMRKLIALYYPNWWRDHGRSLFRVDFRVPLQSTLR